MSSRNDYRRRDRSWERDDRDKDRDRDRGRDRYSRRRSSRSRSPRRGGADSRRSGMCYQYIHLFTSTENGLTVIQIDVTTVEIGTMTDGTGTRGSPIAAMSESDEMQVGGTEKRTGIGMTGTRGKARRVVMRSVRQRGIVSRAHG